MSAARANPVFVAIDTPDLEYALALSERVRPFVGGLKVGVEFLSANGPDGLRAFEKFGLPIFAAVKFHDIPNTVAGAVRAIAAQGVSIVNVHAAGGAAMMRAALEAAKSVNPAMRVIAVTVLTSLADDDPHGGGPVARPLPTRCCELATCSDEAMRTGWRGVFGA